MSASNSPTARPAPRVSVIVPCFNAADYVGQALDSALGQTHGNVEIIVVDDGSTDSTPEVLAGYADRVRILRQQNSGSAAARNRGIDAATGELIAFLDADDFWFPDKLQMQVSHLMSCGDCGVVYCGWLALSADSDGRFPQPVRSAPNVGEDLIDPDRSGWLYHLLLQDSVVHTSTAVFRRDVIESVGRFDESLRRGQDLDYWLRASRVTQIHKLSAVLSVYRLHAESITRQPNPVNYRARVIEKALATWGLADPTGRMLDPRVVRQVLKQSWRGHGYQHLKRGSADQALRSFSKALKLGALDPNLWWLTGRAFVRKLAGQS